MQDKSFFFHELKMGMICEIKLKSEFNSSAFDKKRSTVTAIISKSQTKLVWSSHKSTSPGVFPLSKPFSISCAYARKALAPKAYISVCVQISGMFITALRYTPEKFLDAFFRRCQGPEISTPYECWPSRCLRKRIGSRDGVEKFRNIGNQT